MSLLKISILSFKLFSHSDSTCQCKLHMFLLKFSFLSFKLFSSFGCLLLLFDPLMRSAPLLGRLAAEISLKLSFASTSSFSLSAVDLLIRIARLVAEIFHPLLQLAKVYLPSIPPLLELQAFLSHLDCLPLLIWLSQYQLVARKRSCCLFSD